MVYHSRCEEGHEAIEDLCVLEATREACDRAHLQRKVLDKAAVLKRVEAEYRLGRERGSGSERYTSIRDTQSINEHTSKQHTASGQ